MVANVWAKEICPQFAESFLYLVLEGGRQRKRDRNTERKRERERDSERRRETERDRERLRQIERERER